MRYKMNKNFFVWDNYSDQPQVIKDKAYKKAMRKKHLKDFIKLFISSFFIFRKNINPAFFKCQ